MQPNLNAVHDEDLTAVVESICAECGLVEKIKTRLREWGKFNEPVEFVLYFDVDDRVFWERLEAVRAQRIARTSLSIEVLPAKPGIKNWVRIKFWHALWRIELWLR